MEITNKYIYLALAFIFKLVFSFLITNNFVMSLVYLLINLILYFILIHNKKKTGNFICFTIIDYLLVYYFVYLTYKINLNSIIFSIVFYGINNCFLFSLIIDEIVKKTSKKALYKNSIKSVDNGLKALENHDYNQALEYFSNSIKEYKQNYLGYMGMCNTLSKMDKKNLRKINYYKKKCLKYAPNELKKSINEKYN